MAASSRFPLPPPTRKVFCNRTLNMRSIGAIGFDMDYTLIHYRPEQWEREAYEHLRRRLRDRGWPVDELVFDPTFVILGLMLDVELGNIVKANRFGYVKRACHGTRMLEFEEQREIYGRVVVDLAEPRWVFLNTLFGLSEANMYAQCVDLLDAGKLPGTLGYRDLYEVVRSSLDEAHMEGQLKATIVADPARFVDLDPELPLALLDLKHAGKKLMLITNSEWHYTRDMMHFAFDGFLERGSTWRDLFDVVIVSARKPAFFTQRNPIFEVIDEAGLLRPYRGWPRPGTVYLGGDAATVERGLGLAEDEILYVGDHLFADVHVTKNILRWRTALVLRELEAELTALEGARHRQEALAQMMDEKERLEHDYSQFRLALQRAEKEYGPPPHGQAEALKAELQAVRAKLLELDGRIAPLAREWTELLNSRWGLLMHTGNDKSHLARQIERHADIYTSRVSNFLYQTPFVYLRSPRQSLPHDLGPAGGAAV